MMKLLIAGAGGMGREAYQWVKHQQAVNHIWDSIEFLDDNLHSLDGYNLSHKISCTIDKYTPKENEYIVCAVGDSRTRMEICHALSTRGAQFASIIHPTAIIADSCTLGEGIIICPMAIISADVRIGDFVIVNGHSFAGHDSILEEGCTISGHCNIMGFTYLEEGAFLGGGAQILPGIRVKRYAKVGAGAVVIKNVEEYITVAGNPARKVSF